MSVPSRCRHKWSVTSKNCLFQQNYPLWYFEQIATGRVTRKISAHVRQALSFCACVSRLYVWRRNLLSVHTNAWTLSAVQCRGMWYLQAPNKVGVPVLRTCRNQQFNLVTNLMCARGFSGKTYFRNSITPIPWRCGDNPGETTIIRKFAVRPPYVWSEGKSVRARLEVIATVLLSISGVIGIFLYQTDFLRGSWIKKKNLPMLRATKKFLLDLMMPKQRDNSVMCFKEIIAMSG